VVQVARERFEELVVNALDDLPESLGRAMRNVAIVVEDGGRDGRLLGLYHGVPLTARDSSYSGVLPDRITVYREAICARCASEADVVDAVRVTVVHEVAHHFGIDDDRLVELGWG